MSETARLLDDVVLALAGDDRDALLAALGDAAVAIHDGSWRTLTGTERDDALALLLTAFDDLSVTVVARMARPDSSLASVVVSGRHVGTFAGVQATGRRVRLSVDAVAVPAEEGGVARLELSPDLRGLMAQLADSGDTLGITSAMVAAVRENDPRASPQWQVAAPPPAPPSRASRASSRRRPAGLVVTALVVGLVAVGGAVAWQWLADQGPLTSAAVSAGTRPGVTTAPAPPVSSPPVVTTSASPTPSAVPTISTAQPSSRPTVQAGRQLVLTSDVLFAFGSSELTANARQSLSALAVQIREADVRGVVQVNGYTDDVGSASKNLTLSRERALAVARVLQPALAGVPVSLQPQGFGEASAVASNATPEGRAKNRRVTIVLPGR